MLELSVATARKYLKYNPTTGRLVWRVNKGTRARAGQEAGCLDPSGYRQVKVDGKLYKAHRICWLLYYGEIPAGQIDHINGNPPDNRIKNLRIVSNTENGRNARRRRDNTSGCTGVCWFKLTSKWHARIKVEGRTKNLGLFTDFEDAVAARKAAELRYGFHKNHGR